MEQKHKIIRTMLKQMPVPTAKTIIYENLPPREADAIYLHDVEQWNLFDIADKLNCTDSRVKQIRRQAYRKLVSVYFTDEKA